MYSRREALVADLDSKTDQALSRNQESEHGILVRASGALTGLFEDIEEEEPQGFLGLFPNKRREAFITTFNQIAYVIGFSSYQKLRGR